MLIVAFQTLIRTKSSTVSGGFAKFMKMPDKKRAGQKPGSGI
jgi:hypothetical protein